MTDNQETTRSDTAITSPNDIQGEFLNGGDHKVVSLHIRNPDEKSPLFAINILASKSTHPADVPMVEIGAVARHGRQASLRQRQEAEFGKINACSGLSEAYPNEQRFVKKYNHGHDISTQIFPSSQIDNTDWTLPQILEKFRTTNFISDDQNIRDQVCNAVEMCFGGPGAWQDHESALKDAAREAGASVRGEMPKGHLGHVSRESDDTTPALP